MANSELGPGIVMQFRIARPYADIELTPVDPPTEGRQLARSARTLTQRERRTLKEQARPISEGRVRNVPGVQTIIFRESPAEVSNGTESNS